MRIGLSILILLCFAPVFSARVAQPNEDPRIEARM